MLRPRLNVTEDTPTRVYLPPGGPSAGPPAASEVTRIASPPAPPAAVPTLPAPRSGAPAASLPPLDYDDATQRRALTLESTQPGKRYRMQHVRWFALGVAVGALAAALFHGGLSVTCKALRAWSACAIRSLEHKPTAIAAVAPAPLPAADLGAPCPAGGPAPAPDDHSADPCPALLAPFEAAEVQTVNVDDLPRSAPDAEREAPRPAMPFP